TAIDEIVHERRDEPVEIKGYDGSTHAQPLGSFRYGFPSPLRGEEGSDSDPAARLPLREVWLSFWADRPAETRDADGLELLRADFTITGYRYGGDRDEPDKPKGSTPEWFNDLARYANPT